MACHELFQRPLFWRKEIPRSEGTAASATPTSSRFSTPTTASGTPGSSSDMVLAEVAAEVEVAPAPPAPAVPDGWGGFGAEDDEDS